MKGKTYLIDFSIGDWSDDGHGKQERTIITSNIPVQELREIYFAACKKLKIRLDGHNDSKLKFPVPCSEYEASTFPQGLYDYLRESGVDIPLYDEDDIFTEQFLNIVLKLIQWQEPKFKYDILTPETFHFYGSDKKERHIGFFGYGLFY